MRLSGWKTDDGEKERKERNDSLMSGHARVDGRINGLCMGQMGSYRPDEMKATDCADLIRKAFRDKRKGDFDGFLAVYTVVKDIGNRNMLRYGWLGTKPLF